MKTFTFLFPIIFLLSTCWLQPTTPTTSSYPPGQEALYYGFFFDKGTASSIKTLSDTYFNACLQKIPEFASFMASALANSSLPETDFAQYFQKPLDPNNQTFDPYYHVTTKYCGDSDCSSYKNAHGAHINSDFEMHLIGYYFTNRTFGVRIALTTEQEALFDNTLFDNTRKSWDSNKQSGFGAIEKALLPGIRLEEIPENFTPTQNKAHITIGTGPNVSAVVTGTDLVQIIIYENDLSGIPPRARYNFELDSEEAGELRGTAATVIHYFGGDPFGETFVIYPSVKALAMAKFQPYLKPVNNNSGAKNINAVNVMLMYGILLFVYSCQSRKSV